VGKLTRDTGLRCGRIFSGAGFLIAGIAAFIEVRSHRPCATSFSTCPAAGHLEPSDYQYLLKGAALLVILGAVLVIVGVVRRFEER
jgi:uncharacterized membrane protein YphA (DoxX/SURF4 family)